MKKSDIKSLYYITHVDNLPSILEHGILSHAQVEAQNVPFTPIYDTQIVSHRRGRVTPNGKSLWNFANVYFQPRNPMLYRVIKEKDKKKIAIVGIQPGILNQPNSFISTGNAASSPSEILPSQEGINVILQLWKIIRNEWWNDNDGSKRQIMAECLIPDKIPPDFVHTIYVFSHPLADQLRQQLSSFNIPIVPEPHMFFQPIYKQRLLDHLFLVEGDMFFSEMQTLTISVNTVGIMGKGLASRAKYQFPDVYVKYQDVCRQKQLQMGQPYLYQRELFLDDEAASLLTPNSNKWFLLFATKNHWKQHSDLAGIENGLKWILNNYKHLGIKSLAMPALGCGLGGLEWRDVGPLMCQYLAKLDVPVAIYLPREQQIPSEFLASRFLLGQ
jgi:O-acetyl-ADP-ribose deacetylase (regulator of RNase III)